MKLVLQLLLLSILTNAGPLLASENAVIGKAFRIKFDDGYRARLFFTMSTVQFQSGQQKYEAPVKLRGVGEETWLCQWLEEDGTFVTLLMNLDKGTAYSSVFAVSEDGEQETWFQEGTLKSVKTD